MDASFGPFRIKRKERQLLGPDGPIDLSARAFDLLTVLVDHPGEVVSKDALFSAAWPGVVVEENTLQVHVSALRRALPDGMIATVHGRGYRYAGPAPELAVAPASQPNAKPVIVVLPFENLSGDPDQQYFSDGITGDITDRLVRFRKFAVIGQYSAAMFRSSAPDFAAIRAVLKADFVISGTVRRAGDRIRITLRLSSAETGEAIWAERYDRPISDIFALQDEISELVASAIARYLDIELNARISTRSGSSLSSYEQTLKGYWLFRKQTLDSSREARRCFEQAVALDPSNAEALGWLSVMICEEWVHEFNETEVAAGVALSAKATALDPMSAICHAIETWTSICVGNLDAALQSSAKGMALNPGDPNIQVNRALALGFDGRYGEASVLLTQARRLEPLPPMWFAEFNGVIAFAEGRYEETLAGVEPIDAAWDKMYALACYGHLGRVDQARALLADLRKNGREPDWMTGVAHQPFRDAEVRDRLRAGLMKALAFSE